MTLQLPWWIYLVIVFILFSGYMSLRAMRAEKRLEQQYIEQQGEIYMERIRQERMKRQRSSAE